MIQTILHSGLFSLCSWVDCALCLCWVRYTTSKDWILCFDEIVDFCIFSGYLLSLHMLLKAGYVVYVSIYHLVWSFFFCFRNYNWVSLFLIFFISRLTLNSMNFLIYPPLGLPCLVHGQKLLSVYSVLSCLWKLSLQLHLLLIHLSRAFVFNGHLSCLFSFFSFHILFS